MFELGLQLWALDRIISYVVLGIALLIGIIGIAIAIIGGIKK